jgi:hypothetical protein
VVIVSAVFLDAWRHHLAGKKFTLLNRLFSRSSSINSTQ